MKRDEIAPVACPLCGDTGASFKEEVCVAELNSKYRRFFDIENALYSNKIEYFGCQNCGLGFFSPMETGDEELYERLQSFDWYYMADKYEYDIARRYLPQEGEVLEVGGGKAAFAEVVGVSRYTGLEFNDKAIERAQRAGIWLIKRSVEAHASLGNTYDAVVSFQVLEHVADPAAFIRGCVDCLKPGGHLIVAVPAHDGFVGYALNNILDMPPHHVTHWSDATLRYLAAPFGLEVLAVEYEPVAECHHSWACKTIWEARLRRRFGIRKKLLDYSLVARFLSGLSLILGKLLPVPLRDIKGHTVVAVYRKL